MHATNLPIIGLCSQGIHIVDRRIGLCRAFDFGSLKTCDKLADEIFCHQHKDEAWWLWDTNGTSKSTPLAKLYSFYANKKNFRDYEKGKVSELLGRFWVLYQNWQQSLLKECAQTALNEFGLKNESELTKIGIEGLRHKYLIMAMGVESHNKSDLYADLKFNYDILRKRLEWQDAVS
jgi:hypothetical protein